jgi:hypothetical protein
MHVFILFHVTSKLRYDLFLAPAFGTLKRSQKIPPEIHPSFRISYSTIA